ncbi:MAG: hypothetical protein ABIS14_11715 [Sphingomonas sp.]
MIDHYDWSGGREAMLRFGPGTGPVVVAALPLFEEANRTRTLVVTVLRMLAQRGISGALPDLPGTGESILPTEQMTLAALEQAFTAAAATFGTPHIVSIRSGALVTGRARGASRWAFAPMDGGRFADELVRIGKLGGAGSAAIAGLPLEIAGNLLSPILLGDLRIASPDMASPCRTVRLASDPQPADHRVDGAPLWRRAEPDNDIVLAESLTHDIAEWIAPCDD